MNMSEFTWGSAHRFVLLLTAFLTHSQLSNGRYDVGMFVAFTVATQIVANPLLYFQILVSQFTRSGPYGLWKAFSLCRGLALALALCGFISLSFWVTSKSAYFVYFYEVLASAARTMAGHKVSFPWTSCKNHWNSESCSLYFAAKDGNNNTANFLGNSTTTTTTTTTTPDLYPFLILHAHPATEFYNHILESQSKFQLQSLLATGFVWVVVFFSIVAGPKSLNVALPVAFIVVVAGIVALFTRAAALPEFGGAILDWLGRSSAAPTGESMERAVQATYHWTASSHFGAAFLLGKHAAPKTPTQTCLLAASFLFTALNFLMSATTTALNARLAALVGWRRGDEIFAPWLVKNSLGWSSLEAPHLWLGVHLATRAAAAVSLLTLYAETILAALSEAAPTLLAPRHAAPKSVVVGGVFCVAGFAFDAGVKALAAWVGDEFDFLYNEFSFLYYSILKSLFGVFLYFVLLAALPVCVSKVASPVNGDLLTFVARQGGGRAESGERWAMRCFHAYLLLIFLFLLAFHYLLPISIYDDVSAIAFWRHHWTHPRFFVPLASVAGVILIVLVGAIVALCWEGACPKVGWNEGRAPLADVGVEEEKEDEKETQNFA